MSLTQNPAQLESIQSSALAVAYSPSRFGMPELSPSSLFYGQRINENIVSAATVMGVGNNLYNEFSAQMHTTVEFRNYITAGATVELSRINIAGYSTNYSYQIHIGGLVKLNESLTTGFCLRNLTRQYYYGGDNTIKQEALIGIGIKPASDFMIDFDTDIKLNLSTGFSVAGKYNYQDLLAVRLAVLTYPQTIEGSVSFKTIDNLSIHADLQYQEILGFSQLAGISFLW